MLNKKFFKSEFAFGGPSNWNKNDKYSILLMDRIIQDKQLIHSCYDYGGHLEFVRNSVIRNNMSVTLIVKCYLNFPYIHGLRRRSICYQIERILKLFDGLDIKIVPQISSIKNFSNNNLENFIRKISKDYLIENLLIETFPAAESISLKLMRELIVVRNYLKLDNKLNLGFTSYENLDQYGFTKELKRFIYKNKLLYAPMRIIGNKKDKNSIELTKNKLLKEMEYEGFYTAITQVSSLDQYNDLINISKIKIDNKLRKNTKLFLYNDSRKKRLPSLNPYGLEYEPNLKKKFSALILYLRCTFKILIAVVLKKRSFHDLRLIFKTDWI